MITLLAIVGGILLLLAFLWAVLSAAAANDDRYAKMTEEEFEAEAKRSSPLGAALQELQRITEGRKVEYMLEQDKHVEADSAESGDKPATGSQDKPNN
jgi:hypothetical protein